MAFAALGAETAESRGTRRLAQFMLDEGIDPSVLLFSSALGSQTNFYTVGACQGEANMGMATTFTETECRDIDMHNSAITDAGFQLTFIGGDIEELGRGLFDFLLGSQS
ncbi:MAG: hypothetical protein QOG04_1235 [Actinomycetota bacterium]|nr:hypothetical protein [Actinomycetota bacterium]